MAAGVTQPGGAGTTIYIYDDASSASGTGYTFAEIAAAFAADFVSNGTNKPSYRAKVSLQVGDTGVDTATTTLVDTAESTVIWDSTKTLIYRATQTTSWFTVLGTKIGSGNRASGKAQTTLIFGANTTLRGTFQAYGSTLKTSTGTIVITSQASPSSSELVNCLVQNSATSGNTFTLLAAVGNLYNADFSSGTTGNVISSWSATSAERITVAATTPTAYVLLPISASQTIKDLTLFGTPSGADFRWNPGTTAQHHLVRPGWTQAAAKFGFAGAATTPVIANATLEYALFNVKLVDGTGAAISGIPVRLTDSVGNAQVSTTTDSAGEISFGSGLLINAVAVMDHYSDGAAYAQRHRSPFYIEINLPTMTGYNANYFGRQYYFDWPGSETVTTTSGAFEDVNDIVNLQEPSGGATNWVECELGA